MTTTAPEAPRQSHSVGSTVRRIIVFALLFALVTLAATGLGGLLGRLIDPAATLAGDTGGLAQSLAFTLIGGPFAALTWWLTWRRLDAIAERGSFGWGFYLAAMSTVALVVFVTAGLTALAALVTGEWLPGESATAIVWSAVWVWHRWMRRHPTRSPLRLSTVPGVIASSYGLILGAVAVAGALEWLFGEAIRGITASIAVGDPWRPVLHSVIWAIGGGFIWWWHWMHERVRDTSTVFAAVALVLVGILGASIAALGGVGTLLFVALRFAFDFVDPFTVMIDPVDLALAAALVGGLVWLFHAGVVRARATADGGDAVRSASALLVSGVGVAATASGIGIVINATLAALSITLAGSDPRTLLLGGIASFAVGAPLWWVVWRPTRGAVPAAAASTSRRVYLIALFGVSAVVALVALLIIGFRIFEFVLGDAVGTGLVDSIRAPLGLLVATALVAGYHFAVWRRDRASAVPGPSGDRAIRRVTIVAAGNADELVAAIRTATGAGVTVWARATDGAESSAPGPTAGDVIAALAKVHAERVLVIAGPGSRVEVIPLAD